jgi:broad specificity phosphatase PhoE
MEAAAGGIPWERIVASPLKRCAEFATELAARLAILPEFDERLREMHFGAWEGKTAAELMESDGDALARFWRDPAACPPPGAESLQAFQERVFSAWRDLRQSAGGRRVLLVGHGGTIRTIVCDVLGHPPERLLELELELGYGTLRWVRLRGGAAELLEEE